MALQEAFRPGEIDAHFSDAFSDYVVLVRARQGSGTEQRLCVSTWSNHKHVVDEYGALAAVVRVQIIVLYVDVVRHVQRRKEERDRRCTTHSRVDIRRILE